MFLFGKLHPSDYCQVTVRSKWLWVYIILSCLYMVRWITTVFKTRIIIFLYKQNLQNIHSTYILNNVMQLHNFYVFLWDFLFAIIYCNNSGILEWWKYYLFLIFLIWVSGFLWVYVMRFVLNPQQKGCAVSCLFWQ